MKRYCIADLIVDMESFGQTEQQAEAYRVSTDGPADITISCDARRILELNSEINTLDEAQYLGTGVFFAREILKRNGTFLHASAVVLDGKAYLFSADSGTGKSTHTKKWCRLFGARYLNDDKPVLRLINDEWKAYGTPWSGKDDLSSPESAPVGGIVFIKRGETNSIRPLSPKETIPLIMRQTLWNLSKGQMQQHLDVLDRLLHMVPLWELTCRNDDEAAFVSHAALTGK